jgi:hypothetical protein
LEEPVDRIRLATEAEVATVRDGADLTAASSVFTFENSQGAPSFAVFRLAPELDPVIFGDGCSDRRKAAFIWGLENGLRMQGNITGYYFNIAADDGTWQNVAKHEGAIQVSHGPELRFFKRLIDVNQ